MDRQQRMLTVMSGKKNNFTYLVRDSFSVDEAAPLTTPRTCTPGPGALAIVDTGNRASISGGSLVFNSAGSGDPNINYATGVTRAVGKAIIVDYVSGANQVPYFGWTSAVAGGGSSTGWFYTGTGTIYVGGSAVGSGVTFDTAAYFAILRAAGAWFIKNNTLVWVDTITTTTPQYAAIAARTTGAGTTSFKSLAVGGFVAPSLWADEYGIATQRIASASPGDSITTEANCWITGAWTAVTGETFELSFRYTDDDNRWCIRASQSDSTTKIIQIEGGTETERASTATTYTNGTVYHFNVLASASTIMSFVNKSAYITYASATFNATATTAKTSHALANFCSWPRTITGAAKTDLDRALGF